MSNKSDASKVERLVKLCGFLVTYRNRDLNDEGRAFTDRAFYENFSVVRFDQALRNPETDTDSRY